MSGDQWIILCISSLYGAFLIFLALNDVRNIKKECYIDKDVAVRLGLSYSRNFNSSFLPRLTGKLEDYDLEIVESSEALSHIATLSISSKFSVNDTSWSIKMKNESNSGAKSGKTGDPEFDEKFVLEHSEGLGFISLLNHEVKQHLYTLTSSSSEFSMDNKGIRVKIEIGREGLAEKLIECINSVYAVMSLLKNDNAEVKKSTIYNIFNDPSIQVRMNNLFLLNNNFVYGEEIREINQNCLAENHLEMRLLAAILLNRKLEQNQIDQVIYSNHLVNLLPQLMPHIKSAKLYNCVPLLISYYKFVDIEVDRFVIIETLEPMIDSKNEEFLLQILEGKNSIELKRKLLIILGRCGSMKCIEILYKKSVLSINRPLKKEIMLAITQIQNRHEVNGEKGWISLCTQSDTDGGLSLPPSDEGGLSIKEET